jgi:hypothetical protein
MILEVSLDGLWTLSFQGLTISRSWLVSEVAVSTYINEPLGAKGAPLVGEEVSKKDGGKVGS